MSAGAIVHGKVDGSGLRGRSAGSAIFLPDETLQAFKKDLGLKMDYTPFLQEIEPFGDFEDDGEIFFFR